MFPTKSILTGANTVDPSLSEKRESMITFFAGSEAQILNLCPILSAQCFDVFK